MSITLTVMVVVFSTHLTEAQQPLINNDSSLLAPASASTAESIKTPTLISTPLKPSATTTAAATTETTILPIATTPRPRGCVPLGGPRNLSIAPRWFFDNVVFPWDKVQCEMPVPRPVVVNGTLQYYLPVDPITGDIVVSSVRTCDAFSPTAVGYFLFDFYTVFYGLPSFNTWTSTSTPPLFSFVILFCIPLSVLTLVVSLSLIRKLLKDNMSSHIYYYHLVIVCSDLIIYVVNALDSVYLMGFVFWPICYALRPVSAKGFIEHASDAANIWIDAMLTITCMTQTLMALDRYFALYFPMIYHVWASRTFVLKCLATILGISSAIGIMEVFSCNGVSMSIANTWNGPVYDSLRMLGLVRAGIRITILVVGLSIQIFACTMIFIKMRVVLKQPKTKRSASTSHSLAPCYLLFGTCVLGFVATGFAGPAILFRNLKYSFTYRIPTIVFTTSGSLYKISTPICSGLGFYIHCASSSQYRQLLMETRPVKALRRHVFDKLTLNLGRSANLRRVGPTGLEASSSGTALSTLAGTGETSVAGRALNEEKTAVGEALAVVSIHHV